MIRSTSCPWAWTQSSRSTPTSSMHNLSFTSRVWWSCSVEKFYLAKYQKSMTHVNFRVHTYYERHRFNPSRHLRSIYHKVRSKYYKLERRALFKIRWYNLPKASGIRGKSSQAYLIWRTLSDKIRQKGLVVHKDLMWALVLNQRKKECQEIRL